MNDRQYIRGFLPYGAAALLVGLVGGFGIALCNQINMFLAGAMPSIVFFPIVNGAGMLLTSAAGIFIWKERFTNRQWFGMVTGAVAIFLLCNLF